MNRKEFLKILSGGALATAFLPNSLLANRREGSSVQKITILHTNDQHSRIEPFDANSKTPNQGGFARRATLVEQIRKEEKNVLLFDCGDIFQGTPYFNLFGGELEFKLMSMMKYDAATMGNHDFDNGLEGFLKALPNAKFPFICSNYDFSNTILDGKTESYKVFKKGNIKIGVFGLGIELEGLVGKKHYQETKYLDPITTAQHYADFLRKDKKCDLVVCLSHLGFDFGAESKKISDKKVAIHTHGIDLILGGHTHTFLPEPKVFQNKIGRNVLVNQVGWAGLLLGRIDFYFDDKKKIKGISWNNQWIDDTIRLA
ncbi:MAG: metallophosphatase [Flavobacteriaceae bacterium]|nr:metallophosphatase [Flavobacteriaceae bacterium]